MKVVCIKEVREDVSNELWCSKGTLYTTHTDGNKLYIHDEDESHHYIKSRYDDTTELSKFFYEHFVIISKIID